MPETATYPSAPSARDLFILSRRAARPVRDPWRHQGVLVEQEPADGGGVVDSATVFLTGRECPWHCVMCDLWQFTTTEHTPAGAIPAQVADAVAALRARCGRSGFPTRIKLYNAGSFFDPHAVPDADYGPIAEAVQPFDSIVVESHPSLVGPRLAAFMAACARASDGLPPAIEVAMGLETAHPEALERMNKRVDAARFAAAAGAIHAAGASLRAFVLVGVPFVPSHEQSQWVQRSIETARECGARVVSLIPTRRGNGAIEALELSGDVVIPRLVDLEDALDTALTGPRQSMHVLADTWKLEAFLDCGACYAARVERLRAVNMAQQVLPRVRCAACGAGGGAS